MTLFVLIAYVVLGLLVVRKAVGIMNKVDRIDTEDVAELSVIGVLCFLIFMVWPMFFLGWLIGKTLVLPVLKKSNQHESP